MDGGEARGGTKVAVGDARGLGQELSRQMRSAAVRGAVSSTALAAVAFATKNPETNDPKEVPWMGFALPNGACTDHV